MVEHPQEISVDVVYADPPWKYPKGMGWKGGKRPGGNVCAYPCMTVEEMVAQHRPKTEPDAVCFMWTTGTMFDRALELLRGWGFVYVTVAFVWVKDRVTLSAYTLPQTEFVILGKKGRSGSVLELFTSKVRQLVHPSTQPVGHSVKPDEVYERIERMVQNNAERPLRKLEMYARRPRDGWIAFGNEIRRDAPGGSGESDGCAPEGMAQDPASDLDAP